MDITATDPRREGTAHNWSYGSGLSGERKAALMPKWRGNFVAVLRAVKTWFNYMVAGVQANVVGSGALNQGFRAGLGVSVVQARNLTAVRPTP